MGNKLNHRGEEIDMDGQFAETRRQIFGKVRRKMIELGLEKEGLEPSVKKNKSPDVIVISDDQSLLFEPQNLRVTEWLKRYFRMDNLGIRDRIRVHPAQNRKMIIELKAAGFEVV